MQTRKDYSKLARHEKLYLLSQICITNNVTPDTPGYSGLITRVCTSKLAMSKDIAATYADDLISAYRADQWEGLARSHQPETEDETPTTSTPRTFEPTTPTLNCLNFKSTAPINHVTKQLAIQEAEYAPKTVAAILLKIARNNDFNDVGRIYLNEAKDTLDDKTLRCQDITNLIKQFYPRMDTEQRSGNIIYVYFNGKNVTQANRETTQTIQPPMPQLYAPPTLRAPEHNLEKETMGDKNKILVGEVTEPIDEGDTFPEET